MANLVTVQIIGNATSRLADEDVVGIFLHNQPHQVATRSLIIHKYVTKKREATMKRIITFGTFDILHIGHIRMLQRARALGDHLTVGVSTDALNWSKKQKNTVYSQFERMEIVKAIAGVDEVFFEHSLDLKGEYIKNYRSDVLVMGNDWEGKFDTYTKLCEVVYLPRTEGISTTELLAEIRASNSRYA